VVVDKAVRVVHELALEAESRGAVVVALSAGVVVQANVALFEPVDAEIVGADVCRGRLRVLADLELQSMDGGRRSSSRTTRDPHRGTRPARVPPRR
jgi:hypothetical protein